jgi:hypothetical protein
MSRRYEYKSQEIRTQRECVEIYCDICGKLADFPLDDNDQGFIWGVVGVGGGSLVSSYSIDGNFDKDKLDLCWECSQAIYNAGRNGQLKSIIKQAKQRP